MNIITTRHYPPDYLKNITETLSLWTNFINSKTNFSFIKFGDGEFFCMMGAPGTNCDQHPYTKELGDKLLAAWNFFSTCDLENIYIAEWGDQPGSFGTPQNIVPRQNLNNPVFDFFNQLMSQRKKHNFKLVNFEIVLQNTLTTEKYNFYKSIKNSKRKKIFIGPERLKNVQSFLNVDLHIQIPLLNSFTKYDKILSACLDIIEDDTIFIFSSGMPTKSLISDILNYKNNITCIDIGSGFDSLFVGGTREGQIETTVVRDFYKELL